MSGSVSWWALWTGALASVNFFVCEATITQPIIEVTRAGLPPPAARHRCAVFAVQLRLLRNVLRASGVARARAGLFPGHAGLIVFPSPHSPRSVPRWPRPCSAELGSVGRNCSPYGSVVGGLACLFVLESQPSSAMMAALGFVLGCRMGSRVLRFKRRWSSTHRLSSPASGPVCSKPARYAGGITASVAIGRGLPHELQRSAPAARRPCQTGRNSYSPATRPRHCGCGSDRLRRMRRSRISSVITT